MNTRFYQENCLFSCHQADSKPLTCCHSRLQFAPPQKSQKCQKWKSWCFNKSKDGTKCNGKRL